MLDLTNYEGGRIIIAARYVVSIMFANGATEILTVTGEIYRVEESVEHIGKLRIWERE